LHQVRELELELIRETAVIKTLNLCLVFAVPPAIALVIFATYVFNEGRLTSSMAFVVLSLFNTLRFPLVVLPKALRGASGILPAKHAHIGMCDKCMMNLRETAGHCLQIQPVLFLMTPRAQYVCKRVFICKLSPCRGNRCHEAHPAVPAAAGD
jgi:hypothetical protein